jgi:hypothetical protein
VDRPLQHLHLDVDLRDAAELVREGGHARVEVRRVGEHDEVGRHHVLVLVEELAEVLGADLLFPLDDELDVARNAAGGLQVAGDRRHVRHHAGLVVGGAAAIEASLALRGLERGREPFLGAPGRLHVVVPIQEDGRRVRLLDPVAVDVGVDARDLQHLHVLDAGPAHDLGRGLGRAAHLLRRKALRGDARNPRQVHERRLELLEMLVQVPERVLHVAVGVRHRRHPPQE